MKKKHWKSHKYIIFIFGSLFLGFIFRAHAHSASDLQSPSDLPRELLAQTGSSDRSHLFSGYIDIRSSFAGTGEGTDVPRGELKWVQTRDSESLTIDLPLTQGEQSSDFFLGRDYGQIYLSHDFNGPVLTPWTLHFGQWDGIFGLERNDTSALFFSSQGLLFNTQPKTNSGFLFERGGDSPYKIQFYISGQRDSGSTDGRRYPELGFKTTLSSLWKWSIGGTFRHESSDVRRLYLNGTATGNLGAFENGFEAMATKAGIGETAWGMGLMSFYPINPTLRMGIRFNLTSQIASMNYLTHEITSGFHWQRKAFLQLKADIKWKTLKPEKEAPDIYSHEGQVSAIYQF